MRLKRVKLFGFKTFADKTEFDVDGEMIAVVGPNGCGKSNLVDAILWGLGEGSTKSLRAASSQDVIFSGSTRRKALGYAEVSLLFDNEDGALPVESSEVSITRRLTRGGDSDYYINRQRCRLRDVLDLLADSGLGRAGYAIVGQKDIDQALAASPEDRRAWLDEAAGVQRYRARKVESLRRLQSAHEHLERVGDILREIEAQREPLREEAEIAGRYKSIQFSLSEVETGLLIVEVARSLREVQELEQRIGVAARNAASETARAEESELKASSLGREIHSLEHDLDLERHRLQSSATSSERARGAIRLLEQKLESLDQLEQNIGLESEGAQMRIIEAEAELEEARVEAELEEQGLAEMRLDCAGAGDEARALSGALRDAEEKLRRGREAHGEHLKHQAEEAHRAARLRAVDREIKHAEKALPEVEKAAAEAKSDLERIEAEQDAHRAASDEQKEKLAALDAVEADEARSLREMLAEIAVLEGRRRGIEATIETHEGLNQGARAVLEAAEKGLLEGVYLPVGEAVEVDKRYATAIETALGPSANDLIVSDESLAKAAIDFLKNRRLGRATFQPLPIMRPQPTTEEMRRLFGKAGVIGRASDLVRCSDVHRPVIESLLGRVVVAEKIEDALRYVKTAGWSRIVTIDGEVVHHSGAVTGGQSAKQHHGLVRRKAEVAELVEQIHMLEKKSASSERARDARQQDSQSIRAAILAGETAAKDLGPAVQEAHVWARSVADELASTLKSIEKLRAERQNLMAQAATRVDRVDLGALEAERDRLFRTLAARSSDAERAATRLNECEARVASATARLQQAERRLGYVREGEKSRIAKLVGLEPDRQRIRDEIEVAAESLARAEKQRDEAEMSLKKLVARKEELGLDISHLHEAAAQARKNAQAMAESAHQAELMRARADAKRAASLQRLVEEYGLTEEDALEREPATEVPPDAASLVPRLRRELRALGDVNLGAIEAYERLSERSGELSGQREDILGGIAEVEAAIKELDGLTRDRFLGTFGQVQGAFSEVFVKLFGGGEGKVSLTRPDDILETGIEIEVTLPGKKRQRLELLSGGERSLCATAFLFALLRVKPSPLVVLDEVDAPLDGRNVERYIELLKEFSGQQTGLSPIDLQPPSSKLHKGENPKTPIQFILITHNPTTIEAAPVWLGVTMQEPGVSTLVPAMLHGLSSAIVSGNPGAKELLVSS